jgi:hypothetical protein
VVLDSRTYEFLASVGAVVPALAGRGRDACSTRRSFRSRQPHVGSHTCWTTYTAAVETGRGIGRGAPVLDPAGAAAAEAVAEPGLSGVHGRGGAGAPDPTGTATKLVLLTVASAVTDSGVSDVAGGRESRGGAGAADAGPSQQFLRSLGKQDNKGLAI